MMVPPYDFDGAYSKCYEVSPQTSMDPRHVYMLHDLLMACGSVCYRTRCLEIGSWQGASATAFIEAINRDAPIRATFCDVQISNSLRRVVDNCNRPCEVKAVEHKGEMELAMTDYDLVFVDGSHDITSVLPELAWLVIRRPLVVVAHDTNATAAGFALCEGAAMLKTAFQNMPHYRWVEDAKQRDDEGTHRGLFIATTAPGLHDQAKSILKKWD